MRSSRIATACLSLWLAASATAADQSSWTYRLFDTTSHNFGYVARGTQVQKRFRITNRLNQPLHIVGAVPSCRICTVARLEKRLLQPGESVDLTATMDTLGFTGPRSVSITVTFDRPYYGQARLSMQCYSRSDIVISPGEVEFGTVRRGTGAQRQVKIEYAGRADWRIERASCSNPAIGLELKQTQRSPSSRGPFYEVTYVLSVSLKPDAPPGTLFDRIVLAVNDAYNKTLDIVVRGTVQADLGLSPNPLHFGTVRASQEVVKQVIVRGVRPFKIVAVRGGDGPFQIQYSPLARRIHFVQVHFKGNHAAGKVEQRFQIETDLAGEQPLELTVSATVTP